MKKYIILVPVIWLKGYPGHVSYPGLKSAVEASLAPKLFKDGFIQILPDEKKEIINPLPEDFPARDILFAEGFDTAEKVKEAGESITDVKGIGKGTYKQLVAYFEK